MSEVVVRGDGNANAGVASTESKSAPAVKYPSWRWVIAAVLLVSVVTGFFDRISVAVLFTDHGFNNAMGTHFNPAALGLLMTAFLLAYACSALFLSFGGDLFGPRRTLGFASGVWGVLMFVMGSCSSYGGMIFSRALLGLTEGPQYSLISKTVQRWFPRHEQTRANAVWMVGSPIGSAIGFPLTIWLVSSYGWRASFYVLGALNLVLVMPLVLAVVRDRPDSEVGTRPLRTPLRLADIRLILSDSRVWLLCGFGAGLLTYLWGLNSWLPTYLQRVRHFDLHHMGIYSSLPFVLMFFAALTSGYIADRTGRYALISAAGLFIAGVLMFVATQISDPQLAALVIAFSAGSWGFSVPTQYALALRVLAADATSTGIGIINGIGNLVGACAPAVIGFIVAETGSYRAGLSVIVIASVLGALSILPLMRFKSSD